jgi:hypothetical protein
MGDLAKFELIINHALSKKEVIIFVCRCTITYSGRAESFLSTGDRIIIIKEDGTLLIHQPAGNNPVNYMKNGSTIDTIYQDGALLLKC